VIDLSSPLSLRNAICFPVHSPAARRETAIGALWLLVPLVGWLMNMGHRIVMVHKMQQGLSPWPSWDRRSQLLRHGLFTWLGMIYYYAPAGALEAMSGRTPLSGAPDEACPYSDPWFWAPFFLTGV